MMKENGKKRKNARDGWKSKYRRDLRGEEKENEEKDENPQRQTAT